MELQFDLDFSELKEEFKKLDEIKKDIKEIKSDEKSDSLATALEGYTNKVNDIIKIIVKELSNKEVTVKGIKDTSEILGKINENIKNIKLPKTDFSGISESIKSISFDELNKSLGEILKNLNIPIKNVHVENFSDMPLVLDKINVDLDTTGLATSAKQDDVIEQVKAPQGSSGDGTIALASADTWYAVPSSAPSEDYTIIVSLENADGTIRWSFNGGGAPSVTNGNLAPNHLAINMGANKTLYFGSSTAGDDVNYSYVEQV